MKIRDFERKFKYLEDKLVCILKKLDLIQCLERKQVLNYKIKVQITNKILFLQV